MIERPSDRMIACFMSHLGNESCWMRCANIMRIDPWWRLALDDFNVSSQHGLGVGHTPSRGFQLLLDQVKKGMPSFLTWLGKWVGGRAECCSLGLLIPLDCFQWSSSYFRAIQVLDWPRFDQMHFQEVENIRNLDTPTPDKAHSWSTLNIKRYAITRSRKSETMKSGRGPLLLVSTTLCRSRAALLTSFEIDPELWSRGPLEPARPNKRMDSNRDKRKRKRKCL